MKQKLNAKDFILIGVLTALMWIICMVISTIMSVAGPVTNVFYPSVVAIPNGIVMMLLLAKVPKKGVFTICAVIQAILFLLVGAFWFIPIGLIIGGVICDFLVMSRNEITMKSMMAAYALFSAIFAFSAICPIKFLSILAALILFTACTTSKSTVSTNVNLSRYEYASIINNDTYHIPAELMEYEIQLFDAVENSHLKLVSDARIYELTPSQQEKLLLVKYGVNVKYKIGFLPAEYQGFKKGE